MSSNIIRNPETLPDQPGDLKDLEARINVLRQQIADLQGDLLYLEEYLRTLKGRQALQAPAVKVHHSGKVSGVRSILQISQRVEFLLLGLLVLIAFVIRVYQLGSFPDTILADEADNVQDAIRILYGSPPANGFFGLDWTHQPAFSAYKMAAFLAMFGINVFALRLSSATISTLALIPFYLLLRRQFSIVASLLATILFATTVWYLNFSRSGWNCSDIGFYMLMAMLFLTWGLDAVTSGETPRWKPWAHFAAAGFFCALGLYGYPAGRAITLATAAFLPVAWLFHRRHFKTLLVGYMVLFGVEALTFAPQGMYIVRNWDNFTGRSSVVVIFNDPAYQADPLGTMQKQLSRNVRGPWDGHVNNTAQYSPVGEPQLDRITGLLTLAGMVLTLWVGRLRTRPETWLWWLMLLAGWALTQLITVSTPNGARGIGYMPTLIYFAGAALDQSVRGVTNSAAEVRWLLIAKRLAVAIMVAAILWVGYSNVKHYVDWQKLPRTRQDRYLYITEREFPDWAADIVDRARNKRNTSNVGLWRESHPFQDIANPYNTSP